MLTTTEAGRRLGLREATIRRMCDEGKFPNALRNGHAGHWRIPESDVEAYREENRVRLRRRHA
jgi:excisionase family DNA binding protein